MGELTFVQDHFAWERDAFSSWDEIFPIGSILTLYHGGTAPLLVGDDKNFWEICPFQPKPEWLSSADFYIYRDQNSYQVWNSDVCLAQRATPEEAAVFIKSLDCAENFPELIPQYIYRKPAGKLLNLLNDPESVLIFLCGWKNFRRQGEELKELNATQRDQFAGFLSLPYWTLKNHRLDQKKRTENAKFPFAEEIIEVRTENFSINSLHYDSVVHVLAPECAKNPATVEFFKGQMLALAEKYDLDAVFVKERNECYALGARHEEFLGEYHNYQVRQLANFYEKDPLTGNTPLEKMFRYLDRIKNNDYVIMTDEQPRRSTEWLEEGLPRPNFLLGSMVRAMAYYNEKSFLCRRQWNRIERK